MEVHAHIDVQPAPSLMYPGREEVIVVGFGDLQADPKLRGRDRVADFGRAERVLEWAEDRGAYVLGMGDYVDSMSPSNRRAWATAPLYDSPRDAMDEMAYQTLDEVGDLMSKSSRWLGLLSGHHFHRFQDGTTTDMLLAQRLETRHLGESVAGLSLFFPSNGHKRKPMARVWATHGQGGGSTIGAPLNKLQRLAGGYEGVDAFFMGHYHQSATAKMSKLAWVGGEKGGTPRLVQRNVVLAVTGSFMRGYLQGHRIGGEPGGTYVERGLMQPNALGASVVTFRPRLEKGGYTTVDVDAFPI